MNLAASRKSRWADLGIRTLSALVLIPLALVALIVGGWAWRGLVLTIFCVLLVEWRGLAVHVPAQDRTRFLALGLAYAGLPALALIWLRDRSGYGAADVLFVFSIVWASDIGAYLVGRLIGGAKLAPAISPGKTVSGAIGGLAFGVLAGLAVARGTGPIDASGVVVIIGIAACISIASALGDLGESALKRRLGVKDSGRLIPGHGGAFDRLDGLLAAAPIAAAIAWLGILASGGVKVPLWR